MHNNMIAPVRIKLIFPFRLIFVFFFLQLTHNFLYFNYNDILF